MATVCCPNCGRKIWLASIVVQRPGDWIMFGKKSFRSTKSRFKRRVRIEEIDDR